MYSKKPATKGFDKFIFLAVAVAILGGCSTRKPLVLMDKSHSIKPASIAVIAGANEPVDIAMAEALTKELEARTSFKVMSQKRIKKKIKKYPYTIERQSPENKNKAVWYSAKGKKKLDRIRKRLKVKYLFVVWNSYLSAQTVTYSRGGGETTYYVTIIGNMIEYPKHKTVSFTNMQQNESPSCLKMTIFKSANTFVDNMVHDTAKKITDKIVALTTPKNAPNKK